MTQLTEGARAVLEAYLADARRALALRAGTETDRIVEEIRAHVQAELASRGPGRATAEDAKDVLERLGPPGTRPAAERAAGRAGGALRTAGNPFARTVWWIAACAAVAVLLLGPATLVWAGSRPGGVLVGFIGRHVGFQGHMHLTAYWVTVGVLAGAVTGAWWALVGWLARRFSDGIRRALGPAAPLLPARAGDVLAVTGLVLLLVSLVGLWV